MGRTRATYSHSTTFAVDEPLTLTNLYSMVEEAGSLIVPLQTALWAADVGRVRATPADHEPSAETEPTTKTFCRRERGLAEDPQ